MRISTYKSVQIWIQISMQIKMQYIFIYCIHIPIKNNGFFYKSTYCWDNCIFMSTKNHLQIKNWNICATFTLFANAGLLCQLLNSQLTTAKKPRYNLMDFETAEKHSSPTTSDFKLCSISNWAFKHVQLTDCCQWLYTPKCVESWMDSKPTPRVDYNISHRLFITVVTRDNQHINSKSCRNLPFVLH